MHEPEGFREFVEVRSASHEEHGLFEYSCGSDSSTFRIAYGEDPTCATRPAFKRLLQHSLDTG